MEGTKRLKDQ